MLHRQRPAIAIAIILRRDATASQLQAESRLIRLIKTSHRIEETLRDWLAIRQQFCRNEENREKLLQLYLSDSLQFSNIY